MFLIITCHILQYHENFLAWILNVGVQIFLIISGYLYGRKKIGSTYQFLIKQFKKILVPYWIFLFFAITMYAIFQPQYINKDIVTKSLLTIGTIEGIGHLWFIRYILLCYLLVPLLNHIRDRVKNSTQLLFAALLTMLATELIFIKATIFTGVYINCFVFGYFIKNFEELEKRENKRNILYLFITILAAAMNFTKFGILADFIPEIENKFQEHLLTTYSHLLLGAMIFILLHKFVQLNKEYTILKLSDKYSYHIYLVHQFFILSPFTVMTLTGYSTLNVLLVYITSCLGGYLLYKTSNVNFKKH